MNKRNAIPDAIAAGILSNATPSAFDFAGNYRAHELKESEVVFRHIVTRHGM